MASTRHHVALRVADLETSVAFYETAFGARPLTRIFEHPANLAAVVMAGPPGVAYRVCLLALDEGVLELYQFLSPVVGTGVIAPHDSAIMHFAIHVTEVAATLARVEGNGGGRFWSEPLAMDGFTIIYVTDPDGNVIEVLDASMDELLGVMLANFPAARL